ncbi:M50 family metallopeptidase [Chungangia koreensis]|uniref:M50 family metallopeptidase n=1 Tax=Chungangia koreensis TaxID=752657 RepID=A0ABV8X3F1_9LACT
MNNIRRVGSFFSTFKFRLHPIMIPFLFLIVISGDIAYYAFIFGSLLFHEFGHLLAAKFCGFNVKSCTIMPYGGELQIVNRQKHTSSQQLALAMGGPIATSILLFISMMLPIPEQSKLITIQCVLLLINLLPILPLDGGQALVSILSVHKNFQETYEKVLTYSVILSVGGMLFLIPHLPDMLPFFLIMLFIVFNNYQQWRYRKYRLAFHRLVNKQLTR